MTATDPDDHRVSLQVTPLPAGAQVYPMGDVNRNGQVESVDALFVLRQVVGLQQLTPAQRAAADVDQDGQLSSVDSIHILRLVAGYRGPGSNRFCFFWQPARTQAGTYTLTAVANDGDLASLPQTLAITVIAPEPHPPTLRILSPDINGDGGVDIVDYSVLVTAFGTSVGDARYDPRADLDGDSRISAVDFSVLVTDFGLRWPPSNLAPNKIVVFYVQGKDEDDEPLTYSATGLPTGAAFDPERRFFRWVPGADQGGSHAVTFIVSDPTHRSASVTLPLTVPGAPDTTPPRIQITQPTDGAVLGPGSALNYFWSRPATPKTSQPHGPFPIALLSNNVFTMVQYVLASVGGGVAEAGGVRSVVSVGSLTAGAVTNGILTLWAGYPTEAPMIPSGTSSLTVLGTVDDPQATVRVNDIPAPVTLGTFSAVMTLTEGANAITATAVDPAGNQASHAISVTLDTAPPPRPTVGQSLIVTDADSAALSGTKTPGTSIWINGVEVVPAGDATTWTAVVGLTEGDNLFAIVAKSRSGVVSTSATANVILDQLPPVMEAAPPAKTNLTPLVFTGTVDDSLTRVDINGQPASRAGRKFEGTVPLAEGPNTITVTAVSPRGFQTVRTYTVVRGTVPEIAAVELTDGPKVHIEIPTTITVTALDREGDPLMYQILLDGQVLADWTPQAAHAWTPPSDILGRRRFEIRVRDGFGGQASKPVDVYVARPAVPPQAP